MLFLERTETKYNVYSNSLAYFYSIETNTEFVFIVCLAKVLRDKNVVRYKYDEIRRKKNILYITGKSEVSKKQVRPQLEWLT
jgi:hypothetical protein